MIPSCDAPSGHSTIAGTITGMATTTDLLVQELEQAKGAVYRDWAAVFFDHQSVTILPGSSADAFDLASLTKPLATGLLAQHAFACGLIDPQEAVAESFPGLDPDLRFWHLLTHQGGLAPVDHDHLTGMASTLQTRAAQIGVRCSAWQTQPPTTATTYSDLGYILAGTLLEQRYQLPLDILFARLANQRSIAYRPLDRPWSLPRPPLENDGTNGQVNDPAARWLGGVAGHAGLWGTAEAVATFLQALRKGELLPEGSWHFYEPVQPQDRFTCALDRPTGQSTAGNNAPDDAVGHLGFTGCSFWLSPSLKGGSLLLTNRVALDGDVVRLNQLRRQLHSAGWQRLRNTP